LKWIDDNGKVPTLSDLRDSGNNEESTDVVMALYRDAYYAEIEDRDLEKGKENTCDVYVLKHRNGATGKATLFFNAGQTRFYDLDKTIHNAAL
jgi:replicative DNA helicase